LRRWTIDRALARNIAEAVEQQGGDYTDVEDLIDIWERVARRNDEHAAVCRREARELAGRHKESEHGT
jgi:hypothetical protein